MQRKAYNEDQTPADGPYYCQPWKGMKETTSIICGGMNAILEEPQGKQVFCQCIRHRIAMANEKEPWSLKDVLLALAPVAHHHALGLALVAHHLVYLMTTHVGTTQSIGIPMRPLRSQAAAKPHAWKPLVDTDQK